jgi:hypothetical protein
MTDHDRLKLLGSYRPPRCRLGSKLFCEIRGWVEVTRVSDGPISWPMTTKRGGKPSLILCGDLARAVRRESNQAVAFHWGVTPQTVTIWRKALDVPRANEGTHRLHHDHALEPGVTAGRAKAHAKLSDPARAAKIAAALRGKPRPRHVIEALREANVGRRQSEETRRRRSDAHRRRGTRPPKAGRPWTRKEDQLAKALPAAEVARRTGRTLTAVYERRRDLKVPDGRRRT